jgi:2-polyprenyl-3-methyl-5-hydroxy-6-metoxy-1,4-benzoquinol methylase
MIACVTPFDKSGLATLSDLHSGEWKKVFTLLEHEQELFLSHESQFRSAGYNWPRDPLHTWSRIWEYPYVYHHLKVWREKAGEAKPTVVDIGSGVTFFPFAVARLGCDVICTDIDPICAGDLKLAAQHVKLNVGTVGFRLAQEGRLPFEDEESVAVYCISVIEHVPNLEPMVTEIARILRPGGLLLMTLDLDLQGTSGLEVSKHKFLIELLGKYFEPKWPHTAVHPKNILLSTMGPYSVRGPSGLRLVWFWAKQRALKPLLGRIPAPRHPLKLAVEGLALERTLTSIDSTK